MSDWHSKLTRDLLSPASFSLIVKNSLPLLSTLHKPSSPAPTTATTSLITIDYDFSHFLRSCSSSSMSVLSELCLNMASNHTTSNRHLPQQITMISINVMVVSIFTFVNKWPTITMQITILLSRSSVDFVMNFGERVKLEN